MAEIQGKDFAAVITVKLPDSETEVNFQVVLTSSTTLPAKDGSVKPLGDCTLADLKNFAEKLESDIWAVFNETSLFDLVVEGKATLSVSGVEPFSEGAPKTDLLLEHLVVLPKVESEISGQPDESSTEEIAESKLEEEPTEETPSTDEDQELPAADKVEEDQIVPVEVSETESVHLEPVREQISEELAPDLARKRTRLRILGRRRPINHPTWTAVDILMNEPAFRDAQAHALSKPAIEVAGILVGPHPEKQPDGRYVVHVSDIIIAKHTRMQGASVTYTPESWRHVSDRLAEMYPDDDAVIVGWYHTHPGFGIFLSGMDRFIHQNFFTQIWHIALVIDPLAKKSGFFCWDRAQSRVDKYEFPWPVWATSSW